MKLWPFNKGPRPIQAETCLHGLVHVGLYDCPDCGQLQIRTNRTTRELLAILERAYQAIREEHERGYD